MPLTRGSPTRDRARVGDSGRRRWPRAPPGRPAAAQPSVGGPGAVVAGHGLLDGRSGRVGDGILGLDARLDHRRGSARAPRADRVDGATGRPGVGQVLAGRGLTWPRGVDGATNCRSAGSSAAGVSRPPGASRLCPAPPPRRARLPRPPPAGRRSPRRGPCRRASGPDGVDQGRGCDQLTGRVGRHGRGLDGDQLCLVRELLCGLGLAGLLGRAGHGALRQEGGLLHGLGLGIARGGPAGLGHGGGGPRGDLAGRPTGAVLGRVGGRSRGRSWAAWCPARRPASSPGRRPRGSARRTRRPIHVGRRPDGRVVTLGRRGHALGIDDAGSSPPAHGAAAGLRATRRKRRPRHHGRPDREARRTGSPRRRTRTAAPCAQHARETPSDRTSPVCALRGDNATTPWGI